MSDELESAALIEAEETAPLNAVSESPMSTRGRNLPKTLAITAITVFVLAGVILGISAFSSSRKPAAENTDSVLSDRALSEQSYDAAMQALRSGDSTVAISLLEQAVLFDSTNTLAKNQLAKQKKKPKPASNSNTDSGDDDDDTTPPAPDSAFLADVTPLTKLLPTSASGYALGSRVGDATDVTVSARPTGPPGAVSLVAWAVHDRKTAKGATDFITNTSKKAYPKDGTSVTIDGASGYFGTDGVRFATVTYVRGRYVFELILTSTSGAPKQERSLAETAAKAFPDKP